MSSTKWNSEIRQLFHETQVRYPHQKLEPETVKAYLEDWRDLAYTVGFKRFADGVRRARTYCDFFPMISKIAELVPPAGNGNSELFRDMADLRRRKAAGEKFYTLGDVFTSIAEKINRGEIKPSDPSWNAWARTFIPASSKKPQKEYEQQLSEQG